MRHKINGGSVQVDQQAQALSRLSGLIVGLRAAWRSETQLQAAIAALLVEAGVTAEREVVLSAGERIDLLVHIEDVRVGVEVKIAGSVLVVARQLQRYGRCAHLDALLLVTSKPRHRELPPVLGGLPVSVCLLQAGAW